jgi:hypothetical protein
MEAAARRLRDLRGRDLAFALCLLVLTLIPFAVAVIRALGDGWVPSGDEARIATRAIDVFSRHPPLTGLPSTTSLYGERIVTNHPGPLEFYLLAIPLRAFGATAGPLLTAAAINATFVVVSLWAIFRRAGLLVMLGAGVLMQAVIWSAGTAVLTDTLSSNMTMYAMLCTAVLAWALVDRDLRLLPLAAFVASYAAQQHLAAGLIVLPLVAVGVGAVVVELVACARRGDRSRLRTGLRFALAAAGVAALCWAPVVIDEITNRPGNITEIVRFARDDNRPTLGLKSGITQVVRAVAPPTVLSKTDVTGFVASERVGPYRRAAGALVVVGLFGVALVGYRRKRALARLAGVTLVLLAVGVVNGSNVPLSGEAARVNLYRWTWAAAFMTWTALGWALALILRPALRLRALQPVALLAVAAVITTSTVVVRGRDDTNREEPAFALERRVDAIVLDRIDRNHPVAVVMRGSDAYSVGFNIIFRLVEAGVAVELSTTEAEAYGDYRRFRPDAGASALFVESGTKELQPPSGAVIAYEVFDPAYTALLDDLCAAAAASKVELAPGAAALIDREFPGVRKPFIEPLLEHLHDDPRRALQEPIFLTLVLKGMLRSPALDRVKVQRLLGLITTRHTITGGERLRISLLTPAQLRAAPPADLR